ncbi:hypothetical protein HYPSUDRAFT_150847, partial [Hypholoma sublateritium FD-334 SS-4]
TNETIGIIPVPSDIRESSGMAEFNPNVDHNRKHHYLASKQGTRKAILPVHTPAEYALFKHFMKTDDAFGTRSKGPIWPQCVQVWNTYADTHEDIYYKLVEQLKTYHAHWMVTLNVKQSKSLSSTARRPINEAARDPLRSVKAPPVLQKSPERNSVTTGFNPVPITAPSANNMVAAQRASLSPSNQPSDSANAESSSMHSPIPSSRHHSTLPQYPAPREVAEEIARQRVAHQLQTSRVPNKVRKSRTCRKCAQPGCPGSQRVSNCKNTCRDCGKGDCRGRNTKRPDKTCSEGWE